MSKPKSIIIIGAGIAGLSAGCYGQMNGYQTRIFELHNLPGGLCTSWKRKEYTFDGCIHWLVGTQPGSGFNRIWQELGALQDRPVVDHDEFTRIVGPDGKDLIIYTNIDRLEKHMKELFPADAAAIEEFGNAMRKVSKMADAMDATGSSSLLGTIKMGLKMLPHLGTLQKYSKIPLEEYVQRFKDPFLRQSLTTILSVPNFPTIAFFLTLGWLHNRDAGYPVGGSLPFAQAIEQRYRNLGGEIYYKSRVEKILIEDDRVVGVRLADGTEHRADVVISAADGHATIFDLLDGRYLDDEIRRRFDEWNIFPPIIQVSLGVNRDLADTPHMVAYMLDKPITIAGEEQDTISVRHFGYDPTLAPAGKSVVTCVIPSNHGYWQALAAEPERYEAEKKQVAITVIEQLEKRYPGISDQIEVVDVATPLTFVRYTNNWQGSMEGWLITPEIMQQTMRGGVDKTLPGLDNFYMVGQWVEPGGGIPPAARSGRNIIRRICKQDKRAFATHTINNKLSKTSAHQPSHTELERKLR